MQTALVTLSIFMPAPADASCRRAGILLPPPSDRQEYPKDKSAHNEIRDFYAHMALTYERRFARCFCRYSGNIA